MVRGWFEAGIEAGMSAGTSTPAATVNDTGAVTSARSPVCTHTREEWSVYSLLRKESTRVQAGCRQLVLVVGRQFESSVE